MWLFRGAQSAVFYYVTCTPCAEAADRRKRKKEAIRARSLREKEQSETIVTDQPRPFLQPTAFSTNPGWAEELALGPGPPPRRRGGHRAATHHRIDSWDTGAYSGQDDEQDATLTPSQRISKIGSKHIGDRWNRMMRYQREDEPLWGEDVEVRGSSVGISGQGKADSRASSKYHIPRVPPVNDLHPPIVSGPKSRAETRWMLQPPPSARVMSGKERSSRTAGPPVDYANMRMDSEKSTSRRSVHTHALPLLTTELVSESPESSPAFPVSSAKTPKPAEQELPRPPSPAFYAYGRDESRFVISSPTYSPSDSCSTLSSGAETDESPRNSLHSPDTPVSRPMSKETNTRLEASRPVISRALTSIHKGGDHKNVHMLHLEIQESNDLAVGQVDRVRPWRWSMEF